CRGRAGAAARAAPARAAAGPARPAPPAGARRPRPPCRGGGAPASRAARRPAAPAARFGPQTSPPTSTGPPHRDSTPPTPHRPRPAYGAPTGGYLPKPQTVDPARGPAHLGRVEDRAQRNRPPERLVAGGLRRGGVKRVPSQPEKVVGDPNPPVPEHLPPHGG